MIIGQIKEIRKLRAARIQPFLPLIRFAVLDNLQTIRQRLFAHIVLPVDFCFVGRGPLACICYDDSRAIIYAHQVLNHEEVPPIVMDLLFVHELLHLEIPSRTIGGQCVQHPPEFWQREKELFPGRAEAWEWVVGNLWSCLKFRSRLKQIDVLPNWKKHWCNRSLARPMDLKTKLDYEAVCESGW
jgi:hypothetical protein